MTLMSWYNRCALALLLLSISAYSTASSAPEFAALAMPTVFALWRLSCRSTGRFLLPRLVVNILLIAIIAYAVLRSQGSFAVETIAQVVVLIQIVKIGDRRSPRDDSQILSLSVFMAIAAMLDSNGLWTGVQLAAYLPLLIITVMLFQLFKAAHGAGAIEREGDARIAPGMRRQLRVASGLATMGTLGLALLVFLLMPRGVGQDVLPSIKVQTAGRQMAFTSNVLLGGKGIISDSPTIVLDLVIRDESGENLGNPDTSQYLRGAVLNEYDGRGRWSTAQGQFGSPDRVNAGEERGKIGKPPGPTIRQTISLRGTPGSGATGYLFALWRPISISFKRAVTLWSDPLTHVFRFQADQGALEYNVVSVLSDSVKQGLNDRTKVRYDSVPVRNLASSILTAAGFDPDSTTRSPEDDGRATRAIQDYLRSNFAYTVELEQPGPDKDPVEFFLFERKQGHCEYFSAAMVLLCRSVGIDARMVTGYLATEFNTTTGAYVVRESNAHAWVEAEDGEHRWRRYDPTPPDDLMRIHRPTLGLLGRLRHAMEAVEYAWNSSVVAFDESTRQRILGPSSGEQAGWLARVDRFSTHVRLGGSKLMLVAAMNAIVVFAALASGGFVLAFVVRILKAQLERGGAGSRTRALRGSDDGARFYRDLLKYLSRAGLGKPPWRPPMDHARALASVDAPLSEDVRQVVDSYYKHRFGGIPTDQNARGRLAALLKRVREFRRPPS